MNCIYFLFLFFFLLADCSECDIHFLPPPLEVFLENAEDKAVKNAVYQVLSKISVMESFNKQKVYKKLVKAYRMYEYRNSSWMPRRKYCIVGIPFPVNIALALPINQAYYGTLETQEDITFKNRIELFLNTYSNQETIKEECAYLKKTYKDKTIRDSSLFPTKKTMVALGISFSVHLFSLVCALLISKKDNR